MATKPTTLPRWADVGGSIVEPTSGKKDIGFVAGENPPAEYFNWILYWAYKWAEYLSDGALSGNHTIAGSLTVSTTLGVTGAVTLSSTLGVTGAATLSSTLSVASTLTASNGLTVTTGAVSLNGATSLSLPTRKLQVPAVMGQLSSGTASWSGGYWSGGAAGTVYVPISLHEGDRIKKIVIRHRRGGGTPTYTLKRLDYATLTTVSGSAALAIASGTSDAEGTIDDGAAGNINHTIEAGYQYLIEASIGNASDRFYMATIEYDRP